MTNLRIPGPIPVPQDILDKMSTQMMNHRGPRFKEMLYRVTDGLRQVFRTKNDVFVLTSSGTGAMEAAVVNTSLRARRSYAPQSAPSATASARSPKISAPR